MARDPSVFVHERGLCESEEVGAGTRVWAFAHVMRGAVVGRGCNIGDHAFIEGGARLGDGVIVKNAVQVWDRVTVEDHVFLGPNMIFTNDPRPRADPRFKAPPDSWLPTLVRRGASIGANATVVCGVTIGAHALVAAGAVVTRDVPAHALVAGNPARIKGWVCLCGRSLDAALRCSCGRAFARGEGGDGLAELDPGRTRL